MNKKELRELAKEMHKQYLKAKRKADADTEVRIQLIRFQEEHELTDEELVKFTVALSERIAMGDESNVVDLFAELPQTKSHETTDKQRAFQRQRRLSKASTELRMTLLDLQENYGLSTIELVTILLEIAHRGSLAAEREMWKEYME